MNAPTARFKIQGMDCVDEVVILKQALAPLVGGEDKLLFDVVNGVMSLAPNAATIDPGTIIAAVAKTGMRAEPISENAEASGESTPDDGRGLRTILTAISGAAVIAGFLVHAGTSGLRAAMGSEGAQALPLIAQILYGLSMLSGIWLVLPRACNALIRVRPDMNLLMIVAIAGAVYIGDWLEAATVAFLFSLSLALEAWSVGRARRAISALLSIAPPIAHVKDTNGNESDVPPDKVAVGSIIVVKPGERLPLDGKVTSGSSSINQAPITGESVPVQCDPGRDVFAGTINGDGALEIQTTKAAGDTTLAHIARLVGSAQQKRAQSEQWVEQFARWYTPIVMLVALAVFIIPPLLFHGAWQAWLYQALVLLVISCPCALVISTPVTILAALAAAAKNGVLIKGGVFVEIPATLKAIAVDKTGTLTEGKPAVVAVIVWAGHTETELLQIAAALESPSTHPLAKAVVAHAQAKGVSFTPATDFKTIQGKGAGATIAGKTFWLGSHKYLEELRKETPEMHSQLEKAAAAGQSVVVIGEDDHVCGFIALADRLRPEAKKAIEDLRKTGIEHIVMLTGDSKAAAATIAKETGIDEYFAELLPEDKVSRIEELVKKYKSVAMIGDGINDAPALARSSLAIAMGSAGSDAAIETADVALMSDRLDKVEWLIRHSRRAVSTIKANIAFALTIKAVFVLLTLLGHSSMWAAIAADTGASVLVVMNGLRLASAPLAKKEAA